MGFEERRVRFEEWVVGNVLEKTRTLVLEVSKSMMKVEDWSFGWR